MSEPRAAVVLDAARERRAAVAAELARHGHDVRTADDAREILAATTDASLFAVGVNGKEDIELVEALRGTPGGADAVIVAILAPDTTDIGVLLRAGVSDVWPLAVGPDVAISALDVRLALAKHYARLQVEHTRIGGELSVLKRALDLTGTGFVLTDPGLDDNPIVYANRSFGEMTGYPLEETLGRNCRFLQGDEREQDAVRELAAGVADEASVSVTVRNFRRDGTPFLNEVHVAPVRDEFGSVVRFVGVQVDVTSQQETGARLATERSARRRAERERRRIAIVAAGTASMDRADDGVSVLRALRTAVSELVRREAAIEVADGAAAREGAEGRTWTIRGEGENAVDHRLVLDDAPVEADDRSAVALLVQRAQDALRRVGARHAERELVTAMRESLEPLRPIDLHGLDVVATVVPAGPGLAVGGDFVELVRFADESDGIVLGDVTGQGPGAAALTGLVRHSIRACARLSAGPAETLENVNRVLRDIPDRRRYCAATLLRLTPDPEGADPTITVALAGSPPGLVVTAEGETRTAGTVGTLLGASASPVFTDEAVALRPADALVLFSDGVTEALGGGRDATALLAGQIGGSSTGASDVARAALGASAPQAPHRPDDRAVVVVRNPG